MLTCIGGPERQLENLTSYVCSSGFPSETVHEIDHEILPVVYPSRPAGIPYEFLWHGLMGYSESRVRLIGYEPRNPILMYNLGCNGVGFMPSIYGGQRIAWIVRGDKLGPSIFDPV
jgi:glycine/D-amino acid oxidase-like deaminating enzyme